MKIPFYVGTTRFAFLKRTSMSKRRELAWLMTLKSGDLVNDCDGFNAVVTEVIAHYEPVTSRSFCRIMAGKGRNIGTGGLLKEFTVMLEGGGSTCHTDPPATSVQIEAYFRDNWISEEARVEALAWNMFDTLVIAERLERGEPICDERGIKLPEIREEAARRREAAGNVAAGPDTDR